MAPSSQPYVSIITSCSINPRYHRNGEEIEGTQAIIDRLCDRGEQHFDLYMLHDNDFRRISGFEDCKRPISLTESLARLNATEAADQIKSWLPPGLRSNCYYGISPIRALATNLPDISNLEQDKRETAIQAIRVCATIAHRLGASCVEVVCGYAFRRDVIDNTVKVMAGRDSRIEKTECLLDSLRTLSEVLMKENLKIGLALEIEPGPSYLINSTNRAKELLNQLRGIENIGLNVDIGHMLILEQQGENCLKALKSPELLPRIMHFHVSDHSVSHFADLAIGAIHGQNELAKYTSLFDGCTNTYFTNSIAVEQEAAHSTDEVINSARLVRTWFGNPALGGTRTNMTSIEPARGAVVFVDIISSTQICRQLEAKGRIESITQFFCAYVEEAERIVCSYNGYFDKFTGDGVVAFFLEGQNPNVVRNVLACIGDLRTSFARLILETAPEAADELDSEENEYQGIRIGLAYGDEFEFGCINRGARPQVTGIGKTVIEAARIMGCCDSNDVLANVDMALHPSAKPFFQPHDKVVLKGLDDHPRQIYRYIG